MEQVRDRVLIYSAELANKMIEIETLDTPISAQDSVSRGVTDKASLELHGFLKEYTSGDAAAIVRDNVSNVGLESWRRLHIQFNPRTIKSTLAQQNLEFYPKPAKKLADLPACIAEWEKNLRRCSLEGRQLPDEATKRLALMRMLPSKQREAIYDTADELYPTFAKLSAKIRQMLRDDVDNRQGTPMDVDNIDDDDKP